MSFPELAKRPAEFVLIAGPNGSGKSTLADDYIKSRFPSWPMLNADRVARSLRAEPAKPVPNLPSAQAESVELQAAKLVDTTARCLILLREPLILETVLASDKYRSLVQSTRRQIVTAKDAGTGRVAYQKTTLSSNCEDACSPAAKFTPTEKLGFVAFELFE